VALKGSRGAGLRLGLRFEEWETAVRKRVRKMRIAHLSRLCVNSKKSSQVTWTCFINNSTTDIRPAYGKPVEWNVLSRLAT
jgi:hypothetical protein